MPNFVFVLDTTKSPLKPVHPGQARLLLRQGKAAVFRRYPFTIILKEEVTEPSKNITLKLDPGSKFMGVLSQNSYLKNYNHSSTFIDTYFKRTTLVT